MHNIRFVIPQKLEDLLHPQEDPNVYYVDDELTVREILLKLPNLDKSSDPFLKSEDFQIFFSVMKNFQNLEPKHVDRVWTYAYKTLAAFVDSLRTLFSAASQSQPSQGSNNHNNNNDISRIIHNDDDDDDDDENHNKTTNNAAINNLTSSQVLRASLFDSAQEKQMYCNSFKMILYITCTFIELFEDAEAAKSHGQAFNESLTSESISGQHKSNKRKRKQDSSKDSKDSYKEYDRYKERAFKCLVQLTSLPIHRLTDSSSGIQEIISKTTMRVAYKIIENSSFNGFTKSKELVEYTYTILGLGIERYKQSLTFCLKFIQLLQYKEQLAPLLAHLVDFIVSRHNKQVLVGEILREIDRIDVKDLSRDSSCPRAVSTFLTELAEKHPEYFMPFLGHLLGYLDQDSYLMRNASLTIFGYVLVYSAQSQQQQQIQDHELRDELLDNLLEHTRDMTSYTRAKALAVFSNLSENKCIPLSHLEPFVGAAVGRLMDKSSFVRKQAIKFLVIAVRNNPYSPSLPLKFFQEKLTEEKETLAKLVESQEAEEMNNSKLINGDSKQNGDIDEQIEVDDEDTIKDSQETDKTQQESQPLSQSFKNMSIERENPIVLVHRKINYLVGSIAFTLHIHKSIPLITESLYSKNVTDVAEAIDFFVACHDFGIDEALVGFKRMILLINSQEKSIKDTITAAYKKIFFESIRYEKKNEKEKNLLIVTSLINFLETATIGEAISLELLLLQFAESKDLNKDHIQELWARFIRKKCPYSIQILGILSKTNPSIVNQNMKLCIVNGLVNDDSILVRETCKALQNSLPKKGHSNDRMLTRLAKTDLLFERLVAILCESIGELECHYWYPVCDEIIKTIFLMAENPEQIGDDIVHHISEKHLNGETINQIILARFLHLLGVIAMNLLVHLDVAVFLELKIRNNKNQDLSVRDQNISVSSRRRSRRFEKPDGGDDDIGLGGANALEDFELEFIDNMCDDAVCDEKNLLAHYATMILDVAKDPNQYALPELKQSASLALAKYMMVSEKFCKSHLRLLFTILERSKEDGIKINLLIAVGDLCIRFPNLLDGWTQKIFDSLENHSAEVRRVGMKILSRLILSDSIKVKGQISNIANLMVDDDEELAAGARHFFLELSKKLNAIYNILPDIISRLSDSEKGVNEESFRIVMKFLFELIDKDRHIDRLVDKLCHRFTDTDDERHWSDLAHCLSLLKYSDKSVAKLMEKYDTYKDKLCMDNVHASFASIIASFRKTPNLKNETKQLLDEFELKINQAIHVEDENVSNTAANE